MTKLGFIFSLFFLWSLFSVILVMFNEVVARNIYYIYNVENFFFLIILLFFANILIGSLAGHKIRYALPFLYTANLFCLLIIYLGFYFYMKERISSQFAYYIPSLIIYNSNFFLSCFIMTIMSVILR